MCKTPRSILRQFRDDQKVSLPHRFGKRALILQSIKLTMPQEEANRTDIWHKVFLVAQDEMKYLEYALPRDRSHKVLDLGTGTGIWAFSIVE